MLKKLSLALTRPSDFGPRMQVSSCYITCKGRLLLLQNAPCKRFSGSYGVPAGKLEPLETPLAAVLRETFEETGLLIDSRELHYHTTFFVHYYDLDFIYYVFVLELDTPPKHISLRPKEHSTHLWVSPQEALFLPLMPLAKECLLHIYGEDLIF
ncbi:MAG: NUDIX hydrolase [Simkania sp.]|nr:NUDIX hydrolase [Simkania sp.]